MYIDNIESLLQPCELLPAPEPLAHVGFCQKRRGVFVLPLSSSPVCWPEPSKADEARTPAARANAA